MPSAERVFLRLGTSPFHAIYAAVLHGKRSGTIGPCLQRFEARLTVPTVAIV